jgi:hypothetical protein
VDLSRHDEVQIATSSCLERSTGHDAADFVPA